MLRIKQSQVLLAMIFSMGAVALGMICLEFTGYLLVSYVVGALAFGVFAWILIANQDNSHTNAVGYANMAALFLSLVWIGFAFHWLVSLLLFVVFVRVGFRYLPSPIK